MRCTMARRRRIHFGYLHKTEISCYSTEKWTEARCNAEKPSYRWQDVVESALAISIRRKYRVTARKSGPSCAVTLKNLLTDGRRRRIRFGYLHKTEISCYSTEMYREVHLIFEMQATADVTPASFGNVLRHVLNSTIFAAMCCSFIVQ
ncbi:hypothetical protein PAECIP111893_03551 [Paenibacillus plantiphilus]|uniref:Uncharacterized protein n=1 Tax=Paenibacillus plantiphilus TaxID=2905650 RepID=A0ABN8GM35_9BACL|nr:hypothetical protein PAECIP111893_03551 [Paenibacillus plantiphilus]